MAVQILFASVQNGNDDNLGDILHPFKTLNRAVSLLGPGDTAVGRAGFYNEGFNSIPSGISWATSEKVRIAAYPGETVWLKPLTNDDGAGGQGRVVLLDGAFHYIEFDGINMDGSLLTDTECVFWASTNNGNNPHHIRLQNCEVIAGAIGGSGAICLGGHTLIGATGSHEVIRVTVHGGGLPGLCGFECASYGIYIAGPNNLVDGCEIYDTSGAGIQIYNAAGDPADGNIVRNTRIHDITRTGSLNEVWGIIVVGNNTQLYLNRIYRINVGAANPGNAAIAVSNKSGTKIWSNVLYQNTNSGIFLDDGAVNTEIRNNIAYLSGGSNYVPGASGSTTQDHNSFAGVDPHFVNAAAGDFHLAAGSPAIAAGATLASVPTDADGVAQSPPYDIGAYKYLAAPIPTTTTVGAPTPPVPVAGVPYTVPVTVVPTAGASTPTGTITVSDGQSTTVTVPIPAPGVSAPIPLVTPTVADPPVPITVTVTYNGVPAVFTPSVGTQTPITITPGPTPPDPVPPTNPPGGTVLSPLVPGEPSTVTVLEQTTPRYTATLRDDTGAALPGASLASLTLYLYVLKADGTTQYLRGSAGTPQNVLNANNVTIDANGLVTWSVQVADTTMADATLPFEQHLALFTWTWSGGVKTGRHQLSLIVKNLDVVT